MKLFYTTSIVILLISHTSCKGNKSIQHQLISDTTKIKNNLDSIVNLAKYRNHHNIEALNKTASYIKKQFSLISDSVSEQCYSINENIYKNIICSINTDKAERIVIGAHYDVCNNQDGADDNASGVAGMLELARIIKNANLNYRIDFVAYTLEEPPYYGSPLMGSYVHAKSLYDKNIKIKGMICLEMIGYFNDNEDSQDYPVGLLSLFYGNNGNFITVVQKSGNGDFGNVLKRKMKKISLLPTKSFKTPSFIKPIELSDHMNYWKFGYSAVMVTNTAFYRNRNYHQSTDKIETLDIKRMALVIDEVYLALMMIK